MIVSQIINKVPIVSSASGFYKTASRVYDSTTPVGSNKVRIKGDDGRYLVEVSGDQTKVLGMCARANKRNVNSFKRLMNEMYGVNLKY